MGKIAFLYPGQGSQAFGMGKDFYDNSEISKEIYEQASEYLGFDVADLCFNENDLLNRTDYTQAALVTTCIAMTKEIMQHGLAPDVTAGLSLGEYCAIETAGGMNFEDTICTIWERGKLMHEAVPDGSGGMAAVLGLPGEQVQKVLENEEQVTIANYNCPGQIVITGDKKGIEMITPELKKAGAKRVLPLNVSGPFHSPFLMEAGSKLSHSLEQVKWSSLNIPYVTNVTATYINNINETPELLKKQVSSSVMWEQSIKAMIQNDVDIFVEIGPGKTLSGFMRKIDKEKKVKMFHISTIDDMNNVLQKIKELR